MKITINKRTPTINHLYFSLKRNPNVRIMTKEGKELKEFIAKCVHEQAEFQYINEGIDFENRKLKVSIEIYENWYCVTKKKQNEIKKKDLDNRAKFILDSVFSALNIDDSRIWILTMEKCQNKDKEMAIVTIEAI